MGKHDEASQRVESTTAMAVPASTTALTR
jgi:hypothetical protein